MGSFSSPVSPSPEWSEHSLPEPWERDPLKWTSGLKRVRVRVHGQHPWGLGRHGTLARTNGVLLAPGQLDRHGRSQGHSCSEGLSPILGSEAGPRAMPIQNAMSAGKTTAGSLEREEQKWLSRSGCFGKSPRPRIPKFWSPAQQTAARAFWVSRKENEEETGFSATAWDRRV